MATKEEFEGVFSAHRLSNGRASGIWYVYDLTVSELTASKFVQRVKRDLKVPVFMRDGKVGFKL